LSIQTYKDLICWKEAHLLVIDIYKITSTFPQSEVFALSSQMRRAVVSITSNIAEGFSRQSYKEKLQFYYIAKGSLIEIDNQLLISKDIAYIKEDGFIKTSESIITVHKLINGLIRETKKHI